MFNSPMPVFDRAGGDTIRNFAGMEEFTITFSLKWAFRTKKMICWAAWEDCVGAEFPRVYFLTLGILPPDDDSGHFS